MGNKPFKAAVIHKEDDLYIVKKLLFKSSSKELFEIKNFLDLPIAD